MSYHVWIICETGADCDHAGTEREADFHFDDEREAWRYADRVREARGMPGVRVEVRPSKECLLDRKGTHDGQRPPG